MNTKSPAAPYAPATPIAFSYNESDELGRGCFGVVYHGIDTASHQPLAIKKINMAGPSGDKLRHTLERERVAMDTLRGVTSPFVMAIYEIYEPEDSNFVFVIMQRVPSTTLETIIRETMLTSAEIQRITRQLATGIALLHRYHIAHRDLKPDNISYDSVNQVAVIIDFGFAVKSEKSSLPLTDPHTQFVGSPLYAPPEVVFTMSLQPFKHDIYSFGAIFYELFTRKTMYHDCATLAQLRNAMNKTPCRPCRRMSVNEGRLFLDLTNGDPAQRPEMSVVCELLSMVFGA